jgi:integrase
MTIVTPEIARIALSASAKTLLGLGVFLALGASLRREEVLALRWRDIDLTRATADITRTLTTFTRPVSDADAQPVFATPKTKSSRRRVLLPRFVAEALAQHRLDQTERRAALGDGWRGASAPGDDVIVDAGDGRPWRPDSFSRAWSRIAARTPGIEGLTFHGHRHGLGTLLLLGGVDARVVADLMGHSSTTVTRDLYQGVIPTLREAAGSRLDTLIGAASHLAV